MARLTRIPRSFGLPLLLLGVPAAGLLVLYRGALTSSDDMAGDFHTTSGVLRALSIGLCTYYSEVGDLPPGPNRVMLECLVQSGSFRRPGLLESGWEKNGLFVDPWQMPIRYCRTQVDGRGAFFIYSTGPNKRDDLGFPDDVGRGRVFHSAREDDEKWYLRRPPWLGSSQREMGLDCH